MLLLPHERLLFLLGQHRIQRPHGLIVHRPRILLRKVGGGAVVSAVAIGVVLRPACRHYDLQLFAIIKGVLHLGQVVFTVVRYVPAAHDLRAAAGQPQISLERSAASVATDSV